MTTAATESFSSSNPSSSSSSKGAPQRGFQEVIQAEVEEESSQSTMATTPETLLFPSSSSTSGGGGAAAAAAAATSSAQFVNGYGNSEQEEEEDTTTSAAAAAAAATTATATWGVGALPDDFHKSPEPLPTNTTTTTTNRQPSSPPRKLSQDLSIGSSCSSPLHQFHSLQQIQEDAADDALDTDVDSAAAPQTGGSMSSFSSSSKLLRLGEEGEEPYFTPQFATSKVLYALSQRIFKREEFAVATWIGFWSLMIVTMGVSTITPIRDAIALQVGVQVLPKLTLASSVLAFLSSVPIGWLFEAPDPSRRKVWKKMGLTRGATQGSSLALFYRFFALAVTSYAIGFSLVDRFNQSSTRTLTWVAEWLHGGGGGGDGDGGSHPDSVLSSLLLEWLPLIMAKFGQVMYIAFFLVVHLMKLHSISLVWGVTSEAMEYEDVARKAKEQKRSMNHNNSSGSGGSGSSTSSGGSNNNNNNNSYVKPKTRTRLQRLALVGFGGTLGGIWGSILASSLVNVLHLPGLLIVSAVLLEISAQLSIEMGRIMQGHWEEQQIFRSSQDLASLDPSMKRSSSLGSMKRVASGNSLYNAHNMKRVASGNSMTQSLSAKSLNEMDTNSSTTTQQSPQEHSSGQLSPQHSLGDSKPDTPPMFIPDVVVDDNTFTQRLLRGITTILKSRLLMAIFTYNALFASTTVLLSFQRAELVVNRSPDATNVTQDTAFLARINMASSMAVFCMQASGLGALLAQLLGPRGSLALMPAIRLMGVLSLAWWHRTSQGQPPNLILFLILDECTRVVNLAVAKPVRESLWRGLSNEARYEAKPIVDTLANRWGAGSASFCVSVVNRILLYVGVPDPAADGEVMGLPPILFLCLLAAAWWAMVSLDLGHIRRRIDMELKKRQ